MARLEGGADRTWLGGGEEGRSAWVEAAYRDEFGLANRRRDILAKNREGT